MRTALLIAVSLLAAGCSHATVKQPEPTGETSRPAPASSAPARSSTPVPSTPPRSGAPIADVIRWIEAGRPVDTAGYHTATRDGETTDLGDQIAFTVAAGQAGGTSCVTDGGGALACLVDLADPPPRPEGVYGEWKGNWVDFAGTTVQVGSAHGDPGPFHSGDGPNLPDGAALSFGDYRCRTDQTGLFCVNYAHRSAVRLSSAGVEPFGCLHQATAPDGIGRSFSC